MQLLGLGNQGVDNWHRETWYAKICRVGVVATYGVLVLGRPRVVFRGWVGMDLRRWE